jgi:hypothetical protein
MRHYQLKVESDFPFKQGIKWSIYVQRKSTSPFLTSSSRSLLPDVCPGVSPEGTSRHALPLSLSFHFDGVNGVARMLGSSNGRCKLPPSNCKFRLKQDVLDK